MDTPQVVQAFAVQIYTQVIDVVQQINPLTDVDQHQDRTQRVIKAVADWMMGITPEELVTMHSTHAYLPFDRWLTTDDEDFDTTAVSEVVQKRILHGLEVAEANQIDGYTLVHGAGEYLDTPNDHKQGWLAERAANLLVLELE